MTRRFSIRIVTDLDGFNELASDWTHLLERSESREVFLSHEWLYHWTKQYLGVNRLWILVFVDQRERVCAIAEAVRARGPSTNAMPAPSGGD